MREEKWLIWEDMKNLIKGRISILSIIDDKEGFRIKCIGPNEKELIIKFKIGPRAYRNTDEGELIETWVYIEENCPKNFFKGNSFFKVENSLYVKWICKESGQPWIGDEWQHYVIITDFDVLDLIFWKDPEIEIERL